MVLAIAKRIIFFGIVNAFVMITLGITLQLAGQFFGFELGQSSRFLVMAVVIGMSGSFISLWMSKWMAKQFHGVQIIPENHDNPRLQNLVYRVHRYSKDAGLKVMPDVGVYESMEINAFATGPTRNNSLVAFSTGILQGMTDDELDGVIAHEVAHIANGDMVTMTLIQGVINSLVIVASHVIARLLTQDRERGSSLAFYGVYYFTQFVLCLLGSMVVNAFSRWREFRADAGSAQLAGKEKMIAGLRRLQNNTGLVDDSEKAIASLKISGGAAGFLGSLFSTHPPLEERIKRLESSNY